MRINIYTTSGRVKVKKENIRKIVRTALEKEGKEFSEVNLILADDQYLRVLNETYFRKRRTTNVISFNLGEVAEIYVSRDQAGDVDELYYLIMHGLLHVLGYDHRDKKASSRMREKCLEYLARE